MADTDHTPISPLVAELMTASLTMSHNTTNTYIDIIESQLKATRAELDAVRAGVNDLISGPWMPTPAAIRSALYPSEGAVRLASEEREYHCICHSQAQEEL